MKDAGFQVEIRICVSKTIYDGMRADAMLLIDPILVEHSLDAAKLILSEIDRAKAMVDELIEKDGAVS